MAKRQMLFIAPPLVAAWIIHLEKEVELVLQLLQEETKFIRETR
jgi:hypothetical protein